MPGLSVGVSRLRRGRTQGCMASVASRRVPCPQCPPVRRTLRGGYAKIFFSHTVPILHIVPTAFWERGDFARPDAIFGLFFVLYGLPTFPERVTDFSGTGYRLFRNGLPTFPRVAFVTWLYVEFDLFTKFI